MSAVGLSQFGQVGCSPSQVRLLCPPSPHTVHAMCDTLEVNDIRGVANQDLDTKVRGELSIPIASETLCTLETTPTALPRRRVPAC